MACTYHRLLYLASSSHSLLIVMPQIRLARAFFAHFPYNRFTPRHSPSIFQPIITSSRSPILECDYNFHKSNSTYFTDLDISRGHLLTCLLGNGINEARLSSRGTDGARRGSFGFFLGGVTCHFRREIKPYEAFEVWTRVLSWDEKWLYLVSHIVKAGSLKPRSYILQPWQNGAASQDDLPKGDSHGPHPVIFACSLARYVFKRGRLVITPETILRAANLLPSKLQSPSSSNIDPAPEENSSKVLTSRHATQHLCRVGVDSTIDAALDPNCRDDSWDWKRVDTERVRGMQIAKLMAGLNDLHQEFTAERQPALGRY